MKVKYNSIQILEPCCYENIHICMGYGINFDYGKNEINNGNRYLYTCKIKLSKLNLITGYVKLFYLPNNR